MGAFDGELAALGYRTAAPVTKARRMHNFTGPRRSGRCPGHCSASVCYPCPSNARLSQEELTRVYQIHEKHRIDTARWPDLADRAAREEAAFNALHPGYAEYADRSEAEGTK